MASAKSRGNAFELRCKKFLESLGYKVDKARAVMRPIGPGRWCSSPNDFFGCADLLAVRKDKQYTLFIQCTTSGDGSLHARKRRELQLVPWNFLAQRVQLWQKSEALRGWVNAWDLERGLNEAHQEVFHWEPACFKLKNGDWPGGDIL